MLAAIPTDDESVLGFSAVGNVSGDNYETVLAPALEAEQSEHNGIRLLYHLGPEFDGFEGHAMWDDAKIGMRHLTDFEKIAVVTDDRSMERMVKVIGFLMPCDVRFFSNDEFDAAMTWTAQ